MICIIAAGQGAQVPRMLSAWIRDDGVRARIEKWSSAVGLDLVTLGTRGGAAEIARTEVAQPLLVAQGLLISDLLDGQTAVVAGHSVGELTAAALSGAVSAGDAVWLARQRGLAMAEACDREPTTMAAVVGGDHDDVVARINEVGAHLANHNGAGQLVAAGPVAAIERLQQNPPQGSAVKLLQVAGAFHTPYMASARESFAAVAESVEFRDPVHPILSNLDGLPIVSGEQLKQRLIAQITEPVRWDLCLAGIAILRPDLTISAPPGRVQAVIITRQIAGLRTVAITTPRDLTVAQSLAAELTPSSQCGVIRAGV